MTDADIMRQLGWVAHETEVDNAGTLVYVLRCCSLIDFGRHCAEYAKGDTVAISPNRREGERRQYGEYKVYGPITRESAKPVMLWLSVAECNARTKGEDTDPHLERRSGIDRRQHRRAP